MKKFLLVGLIVVGCSQHNESPQSQLADQIEHSLRKETLDKWYPLAIDTIDGGFLSTFTYDFKPTDDQRKMIVTQARHTWTNARAAIRYPDIEHYKKGARHGYEFLRDVMWDSTYGGFQWLVERDGTPIENDTIKTAYGNAFGLYALVAYYEQSQDSEALMFAKETFNWLEQHSHDHEFKGYFQHLTKKGMPILRARSTPSTEETGYKDQNSSIHLLEALTDLYRIWPDPLVKERLPVSFRAKADSIIEQHHNLDHVSFGHDVETAYLMIEASNVLGIKNDSTTHKIAKRMVDHALKNGWDEHDSTGSFYDEGYYFNDRPGITITRDTKNWWAQAEGMNTLLLMSKLYPNDSMKYYDKFILSWNYINKYLIDHENGDWFAGGIDKQPEMKTALKGQIWKACYHHYRSMTNCMDMLRARHHH
jgi:cellobiose epimerase